MPPNNNKAEDDQNADNIKQEEKALPNANKPDSPPTSAYIPLHAPPHQKWTARKSQRTYLKGTDLLARCTDLTALGNEQLNALKAVSSISRFQISQGMRIEN